MNKQDIVNAQKERMQEKAVKVREQKANVREAVKNFLYNPSASAFQSLQDQMFRYQEVYKDGLYW